jgi:hypothetical protein
MTIAQPAQEETVEAIIISGPRKGEFIQVSEAEPLLTTAETALLDQLTEDARRMAESAREAASEADLLLQELRKAQVG